MKRSACLLLVLTLFLAASPAWGAIAWVQDTTPSNAASATSVTVNFGAATTAGNFIICGAAVANPAGCCSPITFTDSASNSYTALTQTTVSPTSLIRLAYAMNASAATWAKATAGGTSNYLSVTCTEFSGVKTSAAADGFAQAAHYNVLSNSGNITTTNAADILIGFGGIGAVACTMSTGSAGYTDDAVQDGTASQNGLVLAYKIVASTGTYSFDTGGSCGGANSIASQIAAFQAAGAAPPASKCPRTFSLLGVGC